MCDVKLNLIREILKKEEKKKNYEDEQFLLEIYNFKLQLSGQLSRFFNKLIL